MLLVVGLGGNALLPPDAPAELGLQRAQIEAAAAAVAPLGRHGRLVVTHGNGPQVGLLALEQAGRADGGDPLDVLDALTEGMIGYLVETALHNHDPGRPLATLLTQVVVDADDPAFASPTKPIGPTYASEADALAAAQARGWTVRRTERGWRRVVASPEPRRIAELAALRTLVDHGVTVICGGGGGIPVAERASEGAERGGRYGVEAVIDKDLTTALLAAQLDADALLLLTDVDAVVTDFGTPMSRRLHKASTGFLRSLPLHAGSMGPKVEAACRFVEQTGRLAGIGQLADAEAILAGQAGTLAAPEGAETRWWDPPPSP